MSPEQALAVPGEIDHRTDIYSLGAVMYEMLTGSPPIDGSNPLTILRQLIDEDPVPVRQRNPAVPEEVAAICERAIAREKDARYTSAADLADDIEAFLVGHPDWDGSTYPTKFRLITPPAREPSPASLRPTGPWWRRRPLAVASAAVATSPSSGSPSRSRRDRSSASRRIRTTRPRSPSDRRASSGQPRVDVDARPAAEGRPAGRKGKAAPQADPTARALATARELLQPGGTQGLARSARPRDRIKSLLEDLNVLLKANPENAELRFLRGRAFRRAGEMSSSIQDFTQVLLRDPRNSDARTERLLAGYQLHVLYLGNLNERILRPIPVEDLDEDVRGLLKEGDPLQRHLARIIGSLARQDYEQAGTLAEATTPAGVSSEDFPDVRMIEADALFHLADGIVPGGAGDLDAGGRRGREGSPPPPPASPGPPRDHVAAAGPRLRSRPRRPPLPQGRHPAAGRPLGDFRRRRPGRRLPPAAACFRRGARPAAEHGDDRRLRPCHRPHVLLCNFGRESLALDRVNDALSCQPAVPYVHTLKAWLRLMALSDGLLTAEDIARIQSDYQAAFDHPDDANSYFVRALLHAAAGRSEDARSDLRACRRLLSKVGKAALPTPVPMYNDWFVQANTAPLTRYIYATSDVVAYLPVVDDLKIRLAESVLKKLDDPQARKEGIGEDEIKGMKGWTHYRLAVSYAAQNNRQRVLEHVRAALSLKRPDLNADLPGRCLPERVEQRRGVRQALRGIREVVRSSGRGAADPGRGVGMDDSDETLAAVAKAGDNPPSTSWRAGIAPAWSGSRPP